MAGSNHLPKEIMQNILSRLPAESLIRFQKVSKSWHYNISDPYFFKLLMDKYRKSRSHNLYIGYHESGYCGLFDMKNGLRLRELFILDCPFSSPGKTTRLVCSCNGVVLFKIMDDKNVATECVIWNPYSFPPKWRRIMCTYRAFNYNLCYDELRDDLQIVGFYNNCGDSRFVGCVVYSCGNRTWELKKFGDVVHWPGEQTSLGREVYCIINSRGKFGDEVDLPGEQTAFRGAVYCIINSHHKRDKYGKPLATDIARYDPSSDVLQSFPTPFYSQDYLWLEDSYLTTSKESLYFYATPGYHCWPYLKIWVMKDDYSWEHLMDVDYRFVVDPPMSLHFPNGRKDLVIETLFGGMCLVGINMRSKYIGNVPGDVKGVLINHPADTHYFPVMDVPAHQVLVPCRPKRENLLIRNGSMSIRQCLRVLVESCFWFFRRTFNAFIKKL